MTEALLHLVWAERRFRTGFLTTTDGATVDIAHTGGLHSGDGPDFRDAHIRLDGLLFRGEVELHLRCRDWVAHGHHTDPNYNAVVLHVVLHPDGAGAVLRQDGTWCPTLILYPHVRPDVLHLLGIVRGGRRLACHGLVGRVSEAVIDRQFREAEQRYFEAKQTFLLTWQAHGWSRMVAYGMADALGIRHNRASMTELFDRVAALDRVFTTEHEAILTAESLAFRQDPPIRWDRSGTRPDNRPERRVAQAAVIWFRLQGAEPEGVRFGDLIRGTGIGSDREHVLYRNVWLPAQALHAQWTSNADRLHDAVRSWHLRDRQVPDAISTPFLMAGFPEAVAGRSAGTVWQLRERCRAGACDRCGVMAALIRS